ncbi:hypothetical protein NE237_005135 [Protea cynaroides]|uniref:Uncharacterized protein n=1 Tax=Protea cynaroides TaxID=273540 RepID=A0A9Q0KKT8_9MAGN|nr:hypothetical protein NE237_005135 [Protea cynaroides]
MSGRTHTDTNTCKAATMFENRSHGLHRGVEYVMKRAVLQIRVLDGNACNYSDFYFTGGRTSTETIIEKAYHEALPRWAWRPRTVAESVELTALATPATASEDRRGMTRYL